jgi:ketosteroid isomerase-like protein
MKRLLSLVAVLSLAGCAGIHHTEPSQAALLEANRQYDIALVTADAAALDRIYLDDFVYIGGSNAEMRNKQEQIRTMTSGAVKLLEGQSQDIHVKQLGDVAVLTGQFLGRVRIKDKEFSFRERYSTVWQFQNGMWRLVLEHGSVVESKP